MKIIKYEDKYRDDMIFMILEAKNALGRVPGLNEDYWILKGTTWMQEICFGWLLMNKTEL